jgi:hypothetical protein
MTEYATLDSLQLQRFGLAAAAEVATARFLNDS